MPKTIDVNSARFAALYVTRTLAMQQDRAIDEEEAVVCAKTLFILMDEKSRAEFPLSGYNARCPVQSSIAQLCCHNTATPFGWDYANFKFPDGWV